MRIKFSPEKSTKHGEPTWFVHEDDRRVSHELRVSDLSRKLPPHKNGDPAQGQVAINALLAHIGELAAGVEGAKPAEPHDVDVATVRAEVIRLLQLLESADPVDEETHVQWLLSAVAVTVTHFKPHNRSEIARWYQVLLTELEKLLSIAYHRKL